MSDKLSKEWIEDCLKWRGRVLTGKFGHWCYDWDGLPVDETSSEWPCNCKILTNEILGQEVD